MCQTRSSMTCRPRWRGLYARLGAGAAAGATLAFLPLTPLLRTALGCAVAIAAALSALAWIRANAAAIELEAWCDCAPATVIVRRVASARPRRRRRARRRGATLPV